MRKPKLINWLSRASRALKALRRLCIARLSLVIVVSELIEAVARLYADRLT